MTADPYSIYMNLSNINSATLKNLTVLIQKKELLESQLGKVESEISSVFSGVKVAKASKVKAGRPTKVAGKAGGKRGALKEAIVGLLEKAGDAGLSAKEVSEKLGIPNQHVHVWFGTTGKKIEGLTKLGKGIWALKSK